MLTKPGIQEKRIQENNDKNILFIYYIDESKAREKNGKFSKHFHAFFMIIIIIIITTTTTIQQHISGIYTFFLLLSLYS